ncbi:MAG: hypothetical protein CBE07_001505 [Pelagibacteraceae bacterium TMED247]|nr:MAG: hypothetical protein CBE07_001505 [Pelagibacteraceae bacterium TMED247]|tara:strand:+ start:8343 stop:8783 length:441 start_codon:yes stop_codon:yes gene_type:complete
MSSDFKYIFLRIPEEITFKYIEGVKEECLNIDLNCAIMISKVINISTEGVDFPSSIKEDELFRLADGDLIKKEAVVNFLHKSVDEVLIPRVSQVQNLNSSICRKDLDYIKIGEFTYVFTGNQKKPYSNCEWEAYSFLLALKLSGCI